MDNLFLLLFLASFVCLIIGLVKPTVFSRFIKGEITRKKIGLIFGIATVAFFVMFGITTDTSKQTQSNTNEKVTEQKTESKQLSPEEQAKKDADDALAKKQADEAKAKQEAEAKAQKEAEEAAKNVPAEYKSALNKATSYSNTMHMSKRGVYDQLVSEYGEKFSAAAAQYAIDNVKADGNANALAKAKTYQDTMNMSPAGIHDQLTSAYGEKFTQSEADYAIQHLND
ncbi:MAG: Ltp family lipoprotein [Candidatus Levybacteria bacterium]|nr:Ltp family lipoprotein [Candidatus Levybacteria bacterium]